MTFRTFPDFDELTHAGPTCCLCGSLKPAEDPFVFRTEIDDDFYVLTFDICGNCVREMSGHLGHLPKARFDEAQAEIEAVRAQLEVAEEALRIQYELNDHLTQQNSDLIDRLGGDLDETDWDEYEDESASTVSLDALAELEAEEDARWP